ncbi:MAG: hypothetical protein AB8B63_03375 [Granulosicoccus sp.]
MSPSKPKLSRHAFWANHIHAWQSGGLSKARYRREHKLSYHQFIYWVGRTRSIVQAGASTSQAPKFLPVAFKPQAVTPELQVRLPNGAIISGISAESVEVIGALMAQL